MFYHHNDLSPEFDKLRSIRADSLFFNEDGTIKKVIPTLRGIGITKAKSKIQIDRYNAISKEGVSLSFLDQLNKQTGWKILLAKKGAWVRYNSVDFGDGDFKILKVKAKSAAGGLIDIKLDGINGPLLAQVEIEKTSGWKIIITKKLKVFSGVHNLFVTSEDNNNLELDWISFE